MGFQTSQKITKYNFMNKAHYEIIVPNYNDKGLYRFMVRCNENTLIPEIISESYKMGLYRDIEDINVQSIWRRENRGIIQEHIDNKTFFDIHT